MGHVLWARPLCCSSAGKKSARTWVAVRSVNAKISSPGRPVVRLTRRRTMPLRREHSRLRPHAFLCLAILLLTVAPLHAQTTNTLYTFTGGADGGYPKSTLIMDPAGNLYGTTTSDGPYRNGTVFKIDTSNNLSVVHGFATGEGSPSYGLVMDTAGNL